MDKSTFLAGVIYAFFLIGLLTHVYPYSNQFANMVPLAIMCAWLLSYATIVTIFISYGVPSYGIEKGGKSTIVRKTMNNGHANNQHNPNGNPQGTPLKQCPLCGKSKVHLPTHLPECTQ